VDGVYTARNKSVVPGIDRVTLAWTHPEGPLCKSITVVFKEIEVGAPMAKGMKERKNTFFIIAKQRG
jgi:hypothetical protein